jgi:hypothetical protein
MPEPNPNTPVHEQFKALESPRSYYQNVADSITPAQTGRMRTTTSSNSINLSNADKNEVLSSSPPRLRKSSTMFGQGGGQGHDPHISGHEPRQFPGIAHQRERRKSLRASISGSEGVPEGLGLGELKIYEEKE